MSADETALLYHISRRLNSDLDIDRVLADVLELTVQRVGASSGSIMIIDEAGQVSHKILERSGLQPEKQRSVIANVFSQGLAGWVVERREGAVIDDVLSDPRWINFADEATVGGSAISVPLVRHNQVIGVLTLRNLERNHFTLSHLELLSSIADQAAIAVQNARLFHSMQTERAKMEAIINGAGDMIVVTDGQGNLLLMNVVARKAFGVPSDSNLGQNIVDLQEGQALLDLVAHCENSAQPSTVEVSFADERTFHANVTCVPDVGDIIIMQDITDLKELNQMKTEFVSAVSHDLRSPLQLIYTYSGMVADAGPLNQQQQDFLRGINRGVEKISGLIDDLLDFARVEAGVDMEQESCYLDQVIAQVVWRFESIAKERGLSLQTNVPDQLPPIKANLRRIDQVLSNLIDNAIKYTPQGTVTVQAIADDHQVTVYVIDSGIGLIPQEQTEVFQKFYRVQNELTEDIEGTGLGLAIAQSIIEQHGGKIWVQSTWQKGSTFAFSLPRDERG